MSGNKSLKPHLCNGKGIQNGEILTIKSKAWGGTQDMEALFRDAFETEFPATEAEAINLTDLAEKVQEDKRKLNAHRMDTQALVKETP